VTLAQKSWEGCVRRLLRATMLCMALTTRMLSDETWPDFAELVDANNGVWGGCWCMAFHPEGVGPGHNAAGNREAKRRHVRSGTVRQMLVYDGDRCVGWCQFGQPAELPNIKNLQPQRPQFGCRLHRGRCGNRTHRPLWRRNGRGLLRADRGASRPTGFVPADGAGGIVCAVRLHPGEAGCQVALGDARGHCPCPSGSCLTLRLPPRSQLVTLLHRGWC
jgi:hypothetical protein